MIILPSDAGISVSIAHVFKVLKTLKRGNKKQYFVEFERWNNSFNNWIDADQIEDISSD